MFPYGNVAKLTGTLFSPQQLCSHRVYLLVLCLLSCK